MRESKNDSDFNGKSARVMGKVGRAIVKYAPSERINDYTDRATIASYEDKSSRLHSRAKQVARTDAAKGAKLKARADKYDARVAKRVDTLVKRCESRAIYRDTDWNQTASTGRSVANKWRNMSAGERFGYTWGLAIISQTDEIGICNMTELYHHGVKGMKWGVRHKRPTTLAGRAIGVMGAYGLGFTRASAQAHKLASTRQLNQARMTQRAAASGNKSARVLGKAAQISGKLGGFKARDYIRRAQVAAYENRSDKLHAKAKMVMKTDRDKGQKLARKAKEHDAIAQSRIDSIKRQAAADEIYRTTDWSAKAQKGSKATSPYKAIPLNEAVSYNTGFKEYRK